MKNFSYYARNSAVIITSIVIIFLVSLGSCTSQVDSLDQVKDYQPDKKYFKSAMVSLHFITEVSPIPKVDTAFAEMIEFFDLPVDARGARDGKYTGESPYDAFDYAHVVTIEIEDEKIISIDYNEVNKDGFGKQEDTAYCREMSVTGTTPAIAYPRMEQQMLENQNMMEVDAVTGASYSLYRFRYALTVALMKAKI